MQNMQEKTIKDLARECHTVEDIQEMLKKLFKDTLQQIFETEMDEHLGYKKHSIVVFEQFKEKWNKKHSIIIRSWEKNWTELTAYFKYPYEIHRIIYTTNTIEGYHSQIRKVTKTKTSYPSDESLIKIIYLATMDISKKWTMPLRNWKKCISQFAIYFLMTDKKKN